MQDTLKTLVMNLKAEKVTIYIGKKLDPDYLVNDVIRKLLPDKVAVISDGNVFPQYGRGMLDVLRNNGFSAMDIILTPGEVSKSLKTLEEIANRLCIAGFSRRSLVLALGGGVVGDIAGFAASVFMRGIPVIQIPTTLMAQVDSSIGGKTAANIPVGRNMVGTFYQPAAIWINMDFLSTLPYKEFNSAFGEIVKYALVLDKKLFKLLQGIEKASYENVPIDKLYQIILLCVQNKVNVVEKDEKEGNFRKVLNFGHTIGHALEAATAFQLFSHGHAVGWGMMIAQAIGMRLGICTKKWYEESTAFIKNLLSLPELGSLEASSLLEIAERDKKNAYGKNFLVFSTSPGSYEFVEDVSRDVILEVLREFSEID